MSNRDLQRVLHLTSIAALSLLAVAVLGCEELPREGSPPGQPSFDDGFESQLSAQDQTQVIARVNDTTITLKDFERSIDAQPPYARARYFSSPERQKEFLDNLVRFEVLAQEARRRGYDRHPEVVEAMKQTMVRKMMVGEVQGSIRMSDVTQEELQKYYDEHSADYNKPEQVRISQVVLATEADAQAVLVELRKQIEADKREYRRIFAAMAKARSIDEASKAAGGDLRFFARTEQGGEQPKAVADAAFLLSKVGELGGPVQTPAGWHVILLTGRKNRYERTFEQVRRQIQNRLYREKKRTATESFVEGLRTAARVERKDELLTRIKARQVEPPPAPTGPTGPAERPTAGPGAAKGMPGNLVPAGGGPRTPDTRAVPSRVPAEAVTQP